MLKDLPQFVPQDVCLSCDGCCRFKDTESAWRPKIAQEEIDSLQKSKPKLVDQIFVKDIIDAQGYVKALDNQGLCQCSFFNLKDNTCTIYHNRPFECQLYPFLLMKKGKEIVINVHRNCPHIQKHYQGDGFNRYVEILKIYFQKKYVIDFIKRNPMLVRGYAGYEDEIGYVFTVDI